MYLNMFMVGFHNSSKFYAVIPNFLGQDTQMTYLYIYVGKEGPRAHCVGR